MIEGQRCALSSLERAVTCNSARPAGQQLASACRFNHAHGYEFGTLWINLHKAADYVDSSPGLVIYARRYHKGLRVGSAIAESAVNEVVSHHPAKKQQMRWSDEGAYLLARVRVQVLDEEPVPRVRPIPWRPPEPEPDRWLDAGLLQEAA